MEVIIGPMFSGKSTELIRRVKRLQSIQQQVLLVNSYLDTRCQNQVQTHDKKALEAVKIQNISDIFRLKEYKQAKVVAIDEAQFFTELKDGVLKMIQDGKQCIICGLDGDAEQNKFGEILDLIPYTDQLDKLSGYCSMCKDGTEGNFTIRKPNPLSAMVIDVGGAEKYMCVCRKHIK